MRNGIVGAGGAGFPTHVKLNCHAEIVIANGAECEPLLHKDKELLRHHAGEVLAGLRTAMELTSAARGIIAVKAKAKHAIAAIKAAISAPLELFLLGDTYPAGDEVTLCHEVTGRIPPPGGLPLDVGVVVQNVETLYQVYAEKPVTHKWVTVAGAVPRPGTFIVPIGAPLETPLTAAGWKPSDGVAVILGGPMMGQLWESAHQPVTKTLGGLIVLPSDHALIRRYRRPERMSLRIATLACDQCSFCTQLCPRHLLGHPVAPHLAMRHAGMFSGGDVPPPESSRYCCGCNLCSLWSCPEGLDPARVTFGYRARLSSVPARPTRPPEPDPLYAYRKPTIPALKRRIGLDIFTDEAPLDPTPLSAGTVRIPLKQHVGVPAVPVVHAGDAVRKGDLIADIPDNKLGAAIHASIDGTIIEVDDHIHIKGDSPC